MNTMSDSKGKVKQVLEQQIKIKRHQRFISTGWSQKQRNQPGKRV